MKYAEMLELNDQQLKDAYWAAREAQNSSVTFAAAGFSFRGKHPKARKLASSVLFWGRQIDMLVSVARKRGFSVLDK